MKYIFICLIIFSFKNVLVFLSDKYDHGDDVPSQLTMQDTTGYSLLSYREELKKLEAYGYVSIEHGKSSVLIKKFESEDTL